MSGSLSKQSRELRERFSSQVRSHALSSLLQMAIQWLLAKGVTSVLVGVRTKAQLLENLDALEKAPLTETELAKIDAICNR